MNRARHLFVSFFGKNLLLVFVSLILLPGSPSNRKEPALKISNTRLKELREERMLTQGELAELAGISLYTVHAAEHGRNVSPKTGRALSTALGVDPGELLPKAPAPPSSPEAPDASEEERRLAEEATGWAEVLAEELKSFAEELAAKEAPLLDEDNIEREHHHLLARYYGAQLIGDQLTANRRELSPEFTAAMNDVRNRLGQVEEELRKHLDRPETAPGSIQPVPEKRKEGRLLKTSRPEAEKYEEEGRAG